MRLDLALQQRGLAPSRTAALRLIQAGAVSVNGRLASRAAFEVSAEALIEVAPSCETAFVSRAGAKLEGLLKSRPELSVFGYWVDFGQSAGGFTDCLLSHGASRVLGFDVGHDQLHPTLKADPRVQSVEGFNLRHPWKRFSDDHDDSGAELRRPIHRLADLSAFDCQWPREGADGVVIDVSFISISYVIAQAVACVKPGAWCIALIKPQFELGADPVQRRQRLKDGLLRQSNRLPEGMIELLSPLNALGLRFDANRDVMPSVLTGQSGNQEYFLLSQREHFGKAPADDQEVAEKRLSQG